jgi:hypothetical protein
MMGSKQDRPDNLIGEVANALQGELRPDRIHASRRRDSAFEWADGLTRSKWLSRVAPYALAALG